MVRAAPSKQTRVTECSSPEVVPCQARGSVWADPAGPRGCRRRGPGGKSSPQDIHVSPGDPGGLILSPPGAPKSGSFQPHVQQKGQPQSNTSLL